MKWCNAQLDELPDDGDTVLASVNGIYYLAIFNEASRKFLSREDPDKGFSAEDYLIYWTPFTDPET